MREEFFDIGNIPAVLYGEPADSVWLFVHGRQGRKEEGADFARLACPKGAQVLALDLPGHGSRQAEACALVPWQAVPELRRVMAYARERWARVSLRANSIGAWLSMLAFAAEPPVKSLFVSPVLDMERLIGSMLLWAGVTEEELRRRGKIPTDFGETLDIDYLRYVREHPIDSWPCDTAILYAGGDCLTERETVDAFCARFGCALSVMEQGEHWFHTPEQLRVLEAWTAENC